MSPIMMMMMGDDIQPAPSLTKLCQKRKTYLIRQSNPDVL